jgi:hypothetical protein
VLAAPDDPALRDSWLARLRVSSELVLETREEEPLGPLVERLTAQLRPS